MNAFPQIELNDKGQFLFNFMEGNIVAEYPDQMIPFQVTLDPTIACTLKEEFNGKIFVLPLRQKDSDSKITKMVFSSSDVRDIFQFFVREHEYQCLLYLKNITTIEFEISDADCPPYSIYIELFPEVGTTNHRSQAPLLFSKVQESLGQNTLTAGMIGNYYYCDSAVYKIKVTVGAQVKDETWVVHYVSGRTSNSECRYIQNDTM
jgi:hypothetical protein